MSSLGPHFSSWVVIEKYKPKLETLGYTMKLNVCEEVINWLPSPLCRKCNATLKAVCFREA